MTKITFICPSYNHGKYVVNFLNSLLNQVCPDWELIIIDDCSIDDNVKKIRSIQDKRIHFFQNSYNSGINVGWQKGLNFAKTELISFVDSDDLLYPEYVTTVLNTFEKNPEIVACYTPLNHMNQNGELLTSATHLPINKTESEIFADMFLNENLLPSPGMVIKKSILIPYLPLDTSLIQYHDYQFNFFVLFQNKIKLLEKPLVQYRIAEGSACARSPNVLLREEIETTKLMDTVVNLIGQDKNVFLKYFGEYPLIKENEIEPATIPFWLGRLALTSNIAAKRKWGLQTIMNFIGIEGNLELLHRLYGFSYKDYMGYAAIVNEKMPDIHSTLKKYKRKIRKLKKIIIVLIVICLILGGCLWL